MKSLVFTLLFLGTFCLDISAERLKVCYSTGIYDTARIDSICNIVIGDDEDVEAVVLVDTDSKVLAMRFYADYPAANINIYKEGEIMVSVIKDTKELGTAYFDLSKKGKGRYDIKIVVHQDEDLCGNVEI